MFISFEGVDGSGKSTQINKLIQYLEDNKKDYIFLREPGSTDVGEKVRDIVLDKDNYVTPFTEVLLYATSRAQLVEEKIIPALQANKIIVCDRYVDSSVAYQSARDIKYNDIIEVNTLATRDILPDITFFLDIDPSIGKKRVASSGKEDRIEAEKLEFFQKVSDNYRKLANNNKERFITIDANLSIDEIANIVVTEFNKKYNK